MKAGHKIHLGLDDHLGSTGNVFCTLSIPSGFQYPAAPLYIHIFIVSYLAPDQFFSISKHESLQLYFSNVKFSNCRYSWTSYFNSENLLYIFLLLFRYQCWHTLIVLLFSLLSLFHLVSLSIIMKFPWSSYSGSPYLIGCTPHIATVLSCCFFRNHVW